MLYGKCGYRLWMCEVSVDGLQLERVLKLEYLGFVLDESGSDKTVS